MYPMIQRIIAMKIMNICTPKNRHLLWLPFLLLLVACGGGYNEKNHDTPTAGILRVTADDSYKLLVEAERYTFVSMYKYAQLDTVFKPEADVINDFMNDSVQLIVVNRLLTPEQTAYLKERQIIPKNTKIAVDAVAFILNKENPDSTFFYQTIKDIFLGKVTSWKQVNKASKLDRIAVAFDNLRSGNPRYFKERFGIDSFPPACVSAKSNEEVIRFVETNPNAIGVLSVNWISDPADSVSHGFLKRFKVAAIAPEGEIDPATSYFKPYPAYIADGSYPFTRDVYCINRQTYTGLAYGFSSFMAGEKGQMIVLHAGMVPAAMPVRVVEIKH